MAFAHSTGTVVSANPIGSTDHVRFQTFSLDGLAGMTSRSRPRWVRYLLCIASLCLLVAMLPGVSLGALFALAAATFGLILMLLPDGTRSLRAGIGVAAISVALGVASVFGVWPGGGPGSDLGRLGAMLLLFWILPLAILSLAYSRALAGVGEDRDEEAP